jgi:D-alanyl-D-alanine carboxypeptidase
MPRRSLLALLVPAALGAQTPAAPPRSGPALAQRLDSVVRAALGQDTTTGIAVAVVLGRDTLLHAGYGYADVALGVRVTRGTTYRLIFPTAAIGIMQQVERGRLRLDDDASRILPELNWQGRHVTVRQLLDHTSGIPDYHYFGDAQWVLRSQQQSAQQTAALFMGRPYVHEPGAAWSFTASGFHLAGMVLERVSDQAYGDYLREHVFAPAGLRRTFHCRDRAVTPGLATAYDGAIETLVEESYSAPSHYAYLMTVCLNAADAVSLMRALRDGRLMKPDTYRAMTTGAAVARPPRDSSVTYAAGLRVGQLGGRRWVEMSGAVHFMGFRTAVIDFPDDSLTVAVLQNIAVGRESAAAGRLARELGRAVLGLPPLPPVARLRPEPVPGERPLAAAERARYAGTYQLKRIRSAPPLASFETTPRVYEEHGRLVIHYPGRAPMPLRYQGDHMFDAGGGEQLSFTLQNGRATTLTVTTAAVTLSGPRVAGADDKAAAAAAPPR